MSGSVATGPALPPPSSENKTKALPVSEEETEVEQRFPQIFYGDWRRISYLKIDANNVSERLRNPGKMCLSFRRTCYDFVRTAQTLSNRRVAVTWIVDGDWHDRERITVQSERRIIREVQIGRKCGWEVLYIKGNLLLLTGYNGTYKYRAVFQKMHPPLKTITEEAESDG